MKPRALLLAAGALFAVSFFLPAYVNSNGFECLRWCGSLWRELGEPTEDPFFQRVYYPGFVVTNVLFVAILAIGLTNRRVFTARFVTGAAAFFHVVSWFFLNLFKDSIEAIKPGYYLWLLAYALLLAALLVENKKSAAAEDR